MNYILNRIGVALLLGVFASASTFAKVHKGTITLNWDTKVGEVLVKKGTYKVRFDDETSELSILNGKKIIAKSLAQLEPRTGKFRGIEYIVKAENDERRLTNIAFSGSDQTVVLKPTETEASTKN